MSRKITLKYNKKNNKFYNIRKPPFYLNIPIELYKNKTLYLMTLPGILLLFLFNYLPMIGTIIAFKDFQFNLGIIGSPWMKPIYENFLFFFTSGFAWSVTRNTVLLNLSFIIAGIIFEVGFAIIINELNGKYFKRIAQSFTFLPYFVSWIIVSVFAYNLFNYDHGTLNSFIGSIGLQKVDWYSKPELWPFIILLVNRWKFTGYGIIIYIATLAGIDSTYYDAAEIDGASRIKQIRYITLPSLMPTITILTLLAIGRIMNADFGLFYSLVGENSRLYGFVDVIDTFVFRTLRKSGDIGMSAAASLYQSFMAFIIVMTSNMISRKVQKEGAIF
jgi:putative aldouronate transport system permease protein